jgi:hypothetical protein
MQQPQVIDRLLLPADQKAPEPVHPGVRPLHHPAPRFVAGFLFDGLRLLAPCPQMQREPELRCQLAHRVAVIALVQTQALRRFLGRLRSGYGQTGQRLRSASQVSVSGQRLRSASQVSVSCINLWSFLLAPPIAIPSGTPAPSVNTLRLVPPLPRSVGLGPTASSEAPFFRRPVLWSWPRPSRASPSQCPPERRTRRDPVPRVSRKRLPASTLGSGYGRPKRSRYPWRLGRSTGPPIKPQPVRRTKKMPSIACRFGMRLRWQPRGWGLGGVGGGGISGSRRSQSSSGMRQSRRTGVVSLADTLAVVSLADRLLIPTVYHNLLG